MRSAPIIHQFTAMYAERDAVGQHTLAIDSLLREMGCKTALFAERAYRSTEIEVIDFRKHSKHPNPDLILYQLSTGSPVGDYLVTCPQPLILNYHNITPSEYFLSWAPHIANILMQAREQLTSLSIRACAAIADSVFNAEDLYELGMSNVTVVPVIVEAAKVPKIPPSTRLDAPIVLFVGRLAPNKRIECLISALALLRRQWKKARLVIVGSSVVVEYETALRQLVDQLNLNDSVEFTGSIAGPARDALYSMASVYVSASAHEGFCVPVVEAMNAGLPVVAHNSAAVPETAGGAGLLLDGIDPISFAKAIDLVLEDSILRAEMITRGFARAAHFSPLKVRHEMRIAIETLLEAM